MTFSILDGSIPLPSHLFVEASAGTGKTFAIEHAVCRSIAEKGISSDSFVIVTFTVESAKDLKRRITEALKMIIGSNNESSFDYVNRIVKDEEMILRIQKAYDSIDAIHIQTIHSFCYFVMSMFPFESGSQLSQPSFDEGASFSLRPHIEHALSCLREEDVPPVYLLKAMRYSRNDQDVFIKRIESMYIHRHTYDVKLRPFSFSEYTEYTQKFSCWSQEDIVSFCEKHTGVSTRSGAIKEMYIKEISYLLTAMRSGKEYLICASSLLVDKITFSSLKKKEKGNVSEYHHEFILLCEKLSDRLSIERDIGAVLLFIVSHLSPYIIESIEQVDVAVPDELLYQCQQLIQKKDVKETLQKKFKGIIIDEFQDTDEIQWNIFKDTFFSSADFFMCVGDPKQSIYGFRGANIYTYIEARTLFPAKDVVSLSTNYRSGEKLINILNKLFSFDRWLTYDEKLSIEYQQVSSIHESSNSDGVFFTQYSEKEEMLEKIAGIACYYYQSSNKSIAVIVSCRNEARSVENALQRVGVPATSARSTPLTSTLSFDFISLILNVVEKQESLSLIRSIIHHPFVKEAPSEDAVLLLLHSIVRHFEKSGVVGIVSVFKSREFYSVFPTLSSLSKHNYSEYIQCLEYIACKCSLFSSLSSLVRHINYIQKKADDANTKMTPLLAERTVSILTIHMSKGLEFDIVLAPGVSSGNGTSPIALLCDGDIVTKNTPLFEKGNSQREDEKMRQLYVALTRAKSCLHIFVPSLFCKKSKKIENSPLYIFSGRLHASLYDESFVDVCKKVGITEWMGSFGKNVTLESKVIIPFITQDIYLPKREVGVVSFSSLVKKHPSIGVKKEKGNMGLYSMPPGAKTGVIIHECFEKVIEEKAYRPFNKTHVNSIVSKILKSSQLTSNGDSIVDAMTYFFDDMLLDGLPLSSPGTYIDQEVEFMYHDERDCFIKGFIDAIIFHRGKYYIVDWKTNLLGPDSSYYTEEIMYKSMEENDYFMQKKLYRRALKKYLDKLSLSFDTVYGGSLYVFIRALPDKKGIFLSK